MKKLTSGYINYFQIDGSTAGIKVVAFKNINPANTFKLDYVRYIAKAINYMVSSFVYWSDRKNKPVDNIILTNKSLAKNLDCSVSHAAYVITQIKDLFNMNFTRQKYRGGARTIKLNKTFIDFMKIYSEEDYTAFIEAHNIQDSEMLYALRQIYTYRIWGLSSSQLSKDQKESMKQFIIDNRDYLHAAATSNKSNLARIEYINKHAKYLTEMQNNQLSKIREASKLGKLVHYLHSVLIRLEQKISAVLFNKNKDTDTSNIINHSPIERNQTPGETVAEAGAKAEAQKIPEDSPSDMSIKDYYSFMSLWNYIAFDNAIPTLEMLTEKRKQSINQLAKIHSKGDLLKAVKNIRHLYHDSSKYKYMITFERFIQSETFLHVLELSSFDPRVESEDFMDKLQAQRTYTRIVKEIPEFLTHEEAKEWWKLNK